MSEPLALAYAGVLLLAFGIGLATGWVARGDKERWERVRSGPAPHQEKDE
jgi:hypothetical protein